MSISNPFINFDCQETAYFESFPTIILYSIMFNIVLVILLKLIIKINNE